MIFFVIFQGSLHALEIRHSTILLTFIKLPFVIKIFVLSIYERLLYSGFTVCCFGSDDEKIKLLLHVNNKGAYQPARQGCLISTFDFPSLQSIICKLASCKVPIFKLVSVAEQTGLSLAWSETPKNASSCGLALRKT